MNLTIFGSFVLVDFVNELGIALRLRAPSSFFRCSASCICFRVAIVATVADAFSVPLRATAAAFGFFRLEALTGFHCIGPLFATRCWSSVLQCRIRISSTILSSTLSSTMRQNGLRLLTATPLCTNSFRTNTSSATTENIYRSRPYSPRCSCSCATRVSRCPV